MSAAHPTIRSRVHGCLVGGAIGDALGASIEFISIDQIRGGFGPEGIRDFKESYGRVGAITDDTQMTLFGAEALVLASQRFKRDDADAAPVTMSEMVYRAYLRWLVTQGDDLPVEWQGKDILEEGWLMRGAVMHEQRSPGKTCLSALRAGVMGSAYNRINDSKGCGAVMRAAPFGLTGAKPERAFTLGMEAGALTHGHPAGYLSAAALAAIIASLREGHTVRSAVQTALTLLDELQPFENADVKKALTSAVELAASGTAPTAETIATLGEGWTGEEALAISVYCALAAHDPRQAIIYAVNHSGDSDSTGSITGNIVGAARGLERLPEEWVAQVELADVISDLAQRMCDEFWRGKH